MSVKEIVLDKPANEVVEVDLHKLILYNDDFNTFDWVIESLIKVCDHTPEQAEQCALFVHYKGRYAVLSGTFEYLLPRLTALELRNLTAAVE